MAPKQLTEKERKDLLVRYSIGKSSPLHWGRVLELQRDRIVGHQQSRAQLIRAAATILEPLDAHWHHQEILEVEWRVFVDAQFEVTALEHLRRYASLYRRLLTKEVEARDACGAFVKNTRPLTIMRDALEHYDNFVIGAGRAASKQDATQLPVLVFEETSDQDLNDAEIYLAVGGKSLALKFAAEQGATLAELLDKAAQREAFSGEMIAESFSRRHLA